MKAIGAARRLIINVLGLPDRIEALSGRIDDARMLAAEVLVREARSRGIVETLRGVEFRVFSQFGDDGIIQYLIRHVALEEREKVFVEFGVGDYTEACTRFLLVHDDWEGLVMDPDPENVRRIRDSALYWKHTLTAVRAFVDRDNVDRILAENLLGRDVGLLHIDVDGNDYWIWDAVTVIAPVIAIVEYNSLFGPDRAVTVPYDPAFDRTRAHHSNLYWGCSLKALCRLAEKKGYGFVGSNGAGNNAYFVRKDRLGALKTFDARSGYVRSKYRESRAPDGTLSYVSGDDRLRLIADTRILDLESGEPILVGDL
jgi:hypothetical protein